jgi:cyclin L
VYAYLTSTASPLWFVNPQKASAFTDPQKYFVTEGTYERERQKLFTFENIILNTIGFDTHVALPHTIALTYLQALGALKQNLANRVLEHVNGGLLSPQVVYLTHQPNALAAAAIYLAARETGTKLADGNWWEVFDVEREDLGFLVLAYSSLQGFAEAERARWSGRKVPLGIDRSP